MPKFDRATFGGMSVSGWTPAPRSRRGSTNQTDSYWKGGGGASVPIVEYLVIAGGGGGGVGAVGHSRYEGGGGAGGYRSGTGLELPASFTVTVGAGGTRGIRPNYATPNYGSKGSDSVFSAITSTGGGNADYVGGAGNTPSTSPSQGNNGGDGYSFSPYYGGGGGGAGGVGGYGGGAGAGASSSITGSSVTRAAGGTGTVNGNGANGANNSGTGGDAGSQNTDAYQAGNGGSGVVIIAYPDSYPALSSIGGGLTYSVSLVSRAGYRVYTFTAGTGTVTV